MNRNVLLLLALCACIDNSGEMLQLQQNIAFQAPQCTIDPAATIFRPRGTRDVFASSLANYGYVMAPRLRNAADSVEDYPLRFGNNQNVLVDVNDVTIDGFNLCYEFLNFRDATEPNQTPAAVPFNQAPFCKELNGQRQFFVSSTGTAEVSGGLLALTVDLFPPAITGVSFNVDPVDTNVTAAQIAAFRVANAVDPAVTDADVTTAIIRQRTLIQQQEALGDIQDQQGNTFLSGLNDFGAEKTVLVHVQAVGRTRDQRRIESNQVVYPVTLCVGCLALDCAQGIDATSLCIFGQDAPGKCKE